MLTRIKKCILSFYYLMNSNRRKFEYMYYPIISKQFLYLPSRIIQKMTFLLSIILIVIQCSSVVGTLLLAKYGSNMIFLLGIFSICFFLVKKIEAFEIIDDSDHNTNLHLRTASGLYRAGSVLSIFDFLLIVSILMASIVRFILNFTGDEVAQISLLAISCVFIYMTLRNKLSFFVGISISLLFIFILILKDILPSDDLYIFHLSENSMYEVYLKMTSILDNIFFPFVLGVLLWSGVVIFFNNYLVFKRRRYKNKISSFIGRSFNSYSNYMSRQSIIQRFNNMFPLSIILVEIIFIVFEVPSKWEIFPLVITVIFMYNTKVFVMYNSYFFHLFIDNKDKYYMFNLRSMWNLYKEKYEIILYSRGILLLSILLLFAIKNPNFSIYNIVILTIIMLLGAGIPLLDTNLVVFNLQDLKLLKSINYTMNAETTSILFIGLLVIITQYVGVLGIYGVQTYIYLITVFFLLMVILVRIFLIYEYSETWRKEL